MMFLLIFNGNFFFDLYKINIINVCIIVLLLPILIIGLIYINFPLIALVLVLVHLLELVSCSIFF